MAVLIVNVSPDGTNLGGVNYYELRINDEVIARFMHERRRGLSACLRQAAAAYDEAKREKKTTEAINFGWFSVDARDGIDHGR